SSGSTAPCRPSGPTATSSPATSTVATPLHPGCTPTTLNAATAHSAASRPTAECHQPDGRVHLGGGRRRRTGVRRGRTLRRARGPAQRRAWTPHGGDMSRRGTRTVGLLASVASVAVLAACAGAPAGSGGDDGVGDGADGAVADGGGAAGGIMPAEVPAPSELVGLWRVTGDGAPTEDTWA